MKSKRRILIRLCVMFLAGSGIFAFLRPKKEPSSQEIMEYMEDHPLQTYPVQRADESAGLNVTLEDSSGVTPDPTQPAPEGEDSSGKTASADDAKLIEDYIDVRDHILSEINVDLESYFQQVDSDETFTLLAADEGIDYYDLDIGFYFYLEDAEPIYSKVNELDEKSALDQAFLDLYPSLMEIASVLEQINDYTLTQLFYMDDYQAAQEYHTSLLEVYDEYMTTSQAFMDQLNAVAP